jgi:hypothetical protein
MPLRAISAENLDPESYGYCRSNLIRTGIETGSSHSRWARKLWPVILAVQECQGRRAALAQQNDNNSRLSLISSRRPRSTFVVLRAAMRPEGSQLIAPATRRSLRRSLPGQRAHQKDLP